MQFYRFLASSAPRLSFETPGSTTSDFEIQAELGKGSFGVVYKVLSIKDKKIYVLKKIDLRLLKPKHKEKAYEEVQLLKQLNHPHLIKYYNSFLEKDTLNIVMEYADGGDLSQLIKSRKASGKGFSETEIWGIASQLSSALCYLHSKCVIHRDIKTPNILLSKDKQIKLADLGVSKMITPGKMAGTRVGTPLYLAPELVLNKPYDNKVDVWALGCVLYHLAMMEPPFSGDNLISLGFSIVNRTPKSLKGGFSRLLNDFIMKLLEKEPGKRMIMKEIVKEVKEKKGEACKQGGIQVNEDEYQMFKKNLLEERRKRVLKEKETIHKEDDFNKQEKHNKLPRKEERDLKGKEKEESEVENKIIVDEKAFKNIERICELQKQIEPPVVRELIQKRPQFVLRNSKNINEFFRQSRPFSANSQMKAKSTEDLWNRNFFIIGNPNKKKKDLKDLIENFIRPRSALAGIKKPLVLNQISEIKRPQTAYNRISDFGKKKLTIYDLLS